MYFLMKIKYVFLLLACSIYSSAGFAADRSPSLYLNMGGGLVTYKSKFIESNDTSTTVNYSIGMTGGQSNSLNFVINNSATITEFELNTSSIASTFQDTVLRYTLGPAYLGVVFSQTGFIITRETDTAIDLDALGTGTGFNFGVKLNVGKSSQMFLDASSIATAVVKEINDTDFAIGPRTDITLGGQFPITRSMVNGQIGYTQRSYTLSYESQSYAETNSITWLGLGFDWFF